MKNSSDNYKDRLIWVDVLKAFGIVLMVMGHIGFGGTFGKWIHSFHMPLFFVISGFFFSSKLRFSDFVRKKAFSLLVPYFAFGIVDFVFFLLISLAKREPISFKPLFHLFFLNQEEMGLSGALWFLTALFLSECVFFFIKKSHNCVLEIFATVMCLVFGFLIKSILPFRLPWGIDTALVGVAFLSLGDFLKKQKLLIDPSSDKIVVAIVVSLFTFVCASFLALLNKEVNMRTGDYGLFSAFLLSSFAIITSLFFLFKYLSILIPTIFNLHLIRTIGRDSIVFLCLNQPVIAAITLVQSFFSFPKFIDKTICLLFTIAILLLLNMLIMKTDLCVLAGRKKAKN